MCFAQEIFDVRNTYWGMSKADVMKSEYPLKPETSGNDIKYTNVELDYGLTANIYFKFKNEILTEITYAIYGPKNNRGTCQNIIPLFQKVVSINWILKILEEKKYKCSFGWGVLNKSSLHLITGKDSDLYNCSIDKKIVDLIDNEAKKVRGDNILFYLKNDRTKVSIQFNEFQNVTDNFQEYNNMLNITCNDDMYNLMLWLTYEPSGNRKYESIKSKF